MTLHYAPTTPEEEELALALALSASLNSAGSAHCEHGSGSACDSRQSSWTSASTASSSQEYGADSQSACSSFANLYMNPNLSLIYPQIPPPPVQRPSNGSSMAGRSAPSASSSSSSLPSRPSSIVHPQHTRHAAGPSPTRGRLHASISMPASSGARTPAASAPQPHPTASHRSHASPLRSNRMAAPSAPPLAHLPPITQPQPPHPAIPRSKSALGPGALLNGANRGAAGGPGGASQGAYASRGGGAAAMPPQPPPQLFSDPEACAGCGRGFGLLSRSWVTGMGRKWHAACFKCGFCREAISDGQGAFSFQMHPGDPHPYHPDCYRLVHHPQCHVCGQYIPATADGLISYRENGFWRERYCPTHSDAELNRCCACSRVKKQGEEWAPLPDGRPLCLHCLSSVVLDTPDAQPLYDEVLAFYRNEMRLPHAYKPPLLLVDGATLNSHAAAEGRDDSAGAPVFHVRGLCVAHMYSHIPSILRGLGNTVRAVSTELHSPASGRAPAAAAVHCHVKVLLLLYGLPRLLSGSIMAHELMHAWLRMEGCMGLSLKVEEGLCQLMACLWLDRQHELLKGKPDEQRLASFFAYQIRTDTSEVYGEGFREAMEVFQSIGLMNLVNNVKLYGRYTPP